MIWKDAAREVFPEFGVAHRDRLAIHHQLLDPRASVMWHEVGVERLGYVQPAIGILPGSRAALVSFLGDGIVVLDRAQ